MWGHLQHRFDATDGAPRAARRRLRAWLASLDWPEPERDDVVFAVSEAVSNAAEHAYHPGSPGTIVLHANTLTGPNGSTRLSITVSDEGRWQDAEEDTREVTARGRGLAMIRAATEQMRIEAGAAGTCITMISYPAGRSLATT